VPARQTIGRKQASFALPSESIRSGPKIGFAIHRIDCLVAAKPVPAGVTALGDRSEPVGRGEYRVRSGVKPSRAPPKRTAHPNKPVSREQTLELKERPGRYPDANG